MINRRPGDIHSYRDQPKIHETDAKWCAYRSIDGHVVEQTTGHNTEDEARKAVGE